ncbi:hypothetical protein GCM10009765_00030 [Fodinicola feengrottensis]|uniref:non-specific serine/threonine protein kinase n=1 Tax=Fodinicola feengrottensis TaxID=435914 RepID=A0ABN2FP79_9ACTN
MVEARVIAGRYVIRAAIGQGGMGRVWRAHDQTLDREVALKEVLLPLGMSELAKAQMAERMLREARLGARLRHPAIVRVHDVITADNHPWIVMELVDGRSLEELVEAEGALPPARVAALGLSLLGALRAAHKAGVIHRDVKPANVLVEDDDAVVLTDFGIAYEMDQVSLTATGTMIGSPQYMAPERVRGESPGPASDLFSLGATLYAAVEGRAPFARTGQLPTLAAVLSDPPDAFEHAGPLQPVLAGLLEKEPDRRPSAEEVEEALRTIMAVEQAPTTGDLSRLTAGGIAEPAPMVVDPPVVRPERPEPVSVPAESFVRLEPASGAAVPAESFVRPESSTVTSDAPPPAPVVPAPRRRRRLMWTLVAAAVAIVVAVGVTITVVRLNRPEFIDGYLVYTLEAPPAGGYQKVATSKGTLELGEIIRFGRATTVLPTNWTTLTSPPDLRTAPGFAASKDVDSGQLVIQVQAIPADRADHLSPRDWLTGEDSYAYKNRTGYHLKSLKVDAGYKDDSADAAVWSWTWMDGGVQRGVFVLVRQRDGDLYSLAVSGPAVASSTDSSLVVEVFGGLKFL